MVYQDKKGEIMENKQFLVLETLQDGAKKAFHNYLTLIKGFLLSFLAVIVVGAGAILVNWSFIRSAMELLPKMQALESCGENVACQKGLLMPLVALILSNFLILFLTFLFLYIFFSSLWLGYTKYSLKVYDDSQASLKDLFPSFAQVIRFVITGWLYGIIIVLGLLLLLLPGIYWAIRFSFFRCAILDENAGIIQSLKSSWHLTRGHSLQLLGLWILVSILYAISGIIPFSGIITLPLILMIYVCTYRKLGLVYRGQGR